MSLKVVGVEVSREVRNARYRAGRCVDCNAEGHSAGRPRCQSCHQTWVGIPPVAYLDPREW
jgi:tRNA(Ile2) C34 agmatinyltransferase TiaS